MFGNEKLSSSKWKQWVVEPLGSTISSVDQAVSTWFWNLIRDLPRDYFAKTFDQVNYLDKNVWEGIFRARIEDIKEQLKSGTSGKTFEADIVRLQGLVGRYSLSPVTYEDGLKKLEDFVSKLGSSNKYTKLLADVRNEFREELKAQPLLLKECVRGGVNLRKEEISYYKSLLDSLSNTSSKKAPVKSPSLGTSIVNKKAVNNSKLRNISKLLFGNPAQAVTLFLATQAAFASAANIRMNNSSAMENSTLLFEDKLFNLSEVKEGLNSNISTYSTASETATLKNKSELMLEKKVDEIEEILANSTLLPFSDNVIDRDEVMEGVVTNTDKVEGLDVSNSNFTSVDNILPAHEIQMENATLKAVEGSKVLIQPQSEPNYGAATENSTFIFDNEFLSIPEMKDNSTVSQGTLAKDAAIENTKHFLNGNSTFEAGENVILNTEKSSYIVFTKAFNDEMEKVKNEINKLIIALTQVELNGGTETSVQRSKRSVSANSSTTAKPASSGTFVRPDSGGKVTMLQNEMKKMKQDIGELKKSLILGDEDRTRIASLETTVETLSRLLDDQSKEFAQKIANLESLVEGLITIINGFREELDDIKHKAAEQEIIQKQKGLPAECVEAIKSHDFKTAEERLQVINDDSKINLIIKEVYNYQVSNFDLVLKFGDSIRNIKRSFLVYKALNYEMESNGYRDPLKNIKLIESLKKEIINQLNTSSEIKGEAESLVSGLKDTIKVVAKEKLKDGMLHDSYASVTELANKIHSFNNELFKDIIKEVVNDVYGRMNTEKILSMVRSHSQIPQSIQGYVAVFDKMKSSGHLSLSDSTVSPILKLASLIKETMEMPNYRNINQQFKSNLENLKGQLPDIKSFAKEKLKSGMLNDRYSSVSELADKVYNFDAELFGNIIKEVVNDVYGRVDTEKILSIIRSSHSKIVQDIQGYAAVFDKMKSSGHLSLSDSTVSPILKLASLIKETMEMPNYRNIGDKYKSDLESLKRQLPDVKSLAKEKLKDGMLYDRYASVTGIANKIYNFDAELFGNAIKEAIDDVYGRMNTEKILSMIRSHSGYIPQVIQGYEAVFDNMRRNSDLNDRAIFKLAYYIKETMEMSNYHNVNSDKKSGLERLKSMLPEVVRNVVFSRDLCIKNALNNRDLLRGMSTYAYQNNDMFPVRAAGYIDSGNGGKGYKWSFEGQEEGNAFVIRNFACPLTNFDCTNGYLSVENNPTGTEGRHAMVSIDNSRVAWSQKWQIEPYGDNIRIKNVKYNEYLYSANVHSYSDEVYISGSTSRAAEWRVESCKSSRRKRNTQESIGTGSFIKEIEATNLSAREDIKPSSKIQELTLENIKTESQNISSVSR